MSVTESFAKLKEEIDNADREIKAAAEQDRGDIQARRSTMRDGWPTSVRPSFGRRPATQPRRPTATGTRWGPRGTATSSACGNTSTPPRPPSIATWPCMTPMPLIRTRTTRSTLRDRLSARPSTPCSRPCRQRSTRGSWEPRSSSDSNRCLYSTGLKLLPRLGCGTGRADVLPRPPARQLRARQEARYRP